jgi:hypothetical protein
MRKTSWLAGIVVVLIGVAAVGARAAGTTSGKSLVLVQSAPQVAAVDLGDPGPSAGDVLVFRSELLDTTGSQVGQLNITCTQAIGTEHICRGIFTLTGRGQLSVDALPTFPQPVVGIVNGGNGEFQRTRGEVEIRPRADGTTLITFELSG